MNLFVISASLSDPGLFLCFIQWPQCSSEAMKDVSGSSPLPSPLAEHPLLLDLLWLGAVWSSEMALDMQDGERTINKGSRAFCSHCAAAISVLCALLYKAFWNHLEHEGCSIKIRLHLGLSCSHSSTLKAAINSAGLVRATSEMFFKEKFSNLIALLSASHVWIANWCIACKRYSKYNNNLSQHFLLKPHLPEATCSQ